MPLNKLRFIGEQTSLPEQGTDSENFLKPLGSYKIGTAGRTTTLSTIALDVTENHVLEFVFEDDTTWICDQATLEDLFPQAAVQNRAADGSFQLPSVLTYGDERGLGSILLKALNVFKRNKVTEAVIKKLALQLEEKNLNHKKGLLRLTGDFQLQTLQKPDTSKPILLFIHGTNSSTLGSFGSLHNTGLWTYIYQAYGNNVLAYQHATLTESPLKNVADLVKQLPDGAQLHLITHSRGGLVGDILSRFCNTEKTNQGFSKEEKNIFKHRADDLFNIGLIESEIKKKKITIAKFIRVACPAAGTHLASKRLDHFFNMSLNLLGAATGWVANPVFAASKSLIASIINCKNEISVLPGVEAMNPSSPFIKALNSGIVAEGGQRIHLDLPLIVISGNCRAKANIKGLFIIASKLFYREANDLVVHTESMYKGTARKAMVQYFFDEGTDVDHFNYFGNKKTNEAITLALQTDSNALIPGFTQKPLGTGSETERNALLGLEGGTVFTNEVSGKKPILILLPGIMGSSIEKNNKRFWINYFRFMGGGLKELSITETGITATGLIKTSYKKFVDHFSGQYDVVTFPFDWRKHLYYETANLLNEKIEEYLSKNQPIKIVGHSMGGVLVRDFILKHPATWKKLNASAGFKLIFLGAPLGGSFRIPRVLFGDDSIIKQISKIDFEHNTKELIEIFIRFPGILSLLPHTDDTENNFADVAVWKKMREGLDKTWPLPADKELTQFLNYRKAVSKGLSDEDYVNMSYIAGQDKYTPCGYKLTDTPLGKKLEFTGTAEGDQSVTWDSGIPKKMNPQSVYYVPVSHGALANKPELFNGIAELLSQGSTLLFSNNRPVVRGEERLFRMPDTEVYDTSPDAFENTILGLTEEKEQKTSQLPIKVTVSNGDLRYASDILMAGHFLNDGILYAEWVVNNYLDGALEKRNQLGIYPGPVGTSEIIVSGKDHFKGSIIVGLGKYDDFTSYLLTQTVEQAAAKYLLHLINEASLKQKTGSASGVIGISSLIMASGYGGLSIEESVTAILQGIANANEKIRSIYNEEAKQIERVEFVELYEDKALGCFLTLHKLSNKINGVLNIKLDAQKVTIKPGLRKRRPEDNADEWWTQINVSSYDAVKEKGLKESKVYSLKYGVSAAAARSEERILYTTRGVIERMIKDISENNEWSNSKAKTIFELLIPNDFKEQLKRQGNIKWVLDKTSAGFPWELLQDEKTNKKPLCYNAGMIRQLSTQERSNSIREVTGLKALVVGDPDLEDFELPQLPGARREAELVARLLQMHGYEVKALIGKKADEIIEALMSDEYKIIHLAGHGDFKEESPDESGMVIGKNTFLSTREINQMSAAPELVVVNCCFLGKTNGVAESFYRNRYKLAANIGTQLIENNVKAVVAAGWAVNDDAAFLFTEVFYTELFEDCEFGEAVKRARRQVYDRYGHFTNTWGAYQCYGDPYYAPRYSRRSKSTVSQNFVVAEQALIELENLRSKIEMGYTEFSKQKSEKKRDDHVKWLEDISNRVDKADLRNAPITELEAFIYAELYEPEKACMRYESLFTMEKANFSFAARERYCNARMKKLSKDFRDKSDKKQLIVPIRKEMITEIKSVIDDVQALIKTGKTAERFNLLGAACKNLAVFESSSSLKLKAWKNAAESYAAGITFNSNNAVYPLTNLIQVSCLEYLAARTAADKNRIGKRIEDCLHKAELAEKQFNTKLPEEMDYWDFAIQANLKFTAWFAEEVYGNRTGKEKKSSSRKSNSFSSVMETYRKVWQIAGSPGKKKAELDHLLFLTNGLAALSKTGKYETLGKNLEQFESEAKQYL
jgi:CHAT domain-containing protein/pimeloyl-ACP methyl ester carboxylesterase